MEVLGAIIQLLGGLAMFLYGIEVMGDGLKNSSGAALKKVLEKVTGNVVLGVLTGALVTAVIQSSTATIVLTVALIGAGVLNLKQAVSIVMGANIGTTVTAQIIRLGAIESDGSFLLWLFDTDTLAPIALIIGIVLLMFIKRKSAKPIGDICIGFGVLFIGLNLMSDGVKPLIGTDAFTAFVGFLGNPLFGILFGLVLTVIVQSSSATVAMLQSLSATGALDFSAVYPIIMGINIGTCIVTAFYCFVGRSSRDSKRTGVVHVAFNTIGTILFMIAMSIMQHNLVFGAEFWYQKVDSNIIAIFQTVFNLITAVILLPFTDYLVKLSVLIVHDEPAKASAHPELLTLSENLYISPAVALGEATKAVGAMGSLAQSNFALGCTQLWEYNPEICDSINEDENYLDQFADNSDHFLIGLAKNLENERDDLHLDMLMQSVPCFERIGDYATNFVELAQKLKEENAEFSSMAKNELKLLCGAVNEILDITIHAFNSNDNEAAATVEPLEETIDDMVVLLRDRHTKRLKKGECSVDIGLIFMETLTYLERAADQCSSIAIAMLARDNKAIMHNHHEYLRSIHQSSEISYLNQKEMRYQQFIVPLLEMKK